jgi:hypothetical protein
MKNRFSGLARLTMLTAIAALPCGECSSPCRAADGPTSRRAFVPELPPDAAAILKQRRGDERRITIRQANLFHRHFIDACMGAMPEDVKLSYGGVLAAENGRETLKVELTIVNLGDTLHWRLASSFGIFSVWISTERTKQTLAKCNLEGQDIFVNVDFVRDSRSVDDKLPELGGRSVREVLSNIEKPGPKPAIAFPSERRK